MSLVTASFNCDKYLGDCIKSVRSQGFGDYEHLILDDCSTDNTHKVLKKFSKNDPHIRVINTDVRLRCGAAYRKLSIEAQGDIICVLDSDDALASNAIKKLLELYDKNPDVDYIWTQFWLCDRALKKLKKGFSSHPGARTLLEAGIEGQHCFSHWRTFRRKLLEKGPVFPEKLKSAVDKYMGYALEELGNGGFVNIPMYKYRQRVGGLSFTGRKNWKIMKKQFADKRREKNTYVYPIRKIKI